MNYTEWDKLITQFGAENVFNFKVYVIDYIMYPPTVGLSIILTIDMFGVWSALTLKSVVLAHKQKWSSNTLNCIRNV